MASNIGDIRSKVLPRLQDQAVKLTQTAAGDVDSCIAAAVGEYQVARPRQRTKLVVGSGSFDYPLTGGSAILPGYTDLFSFVKKINYPWDATTPTPTELDANEYEVTRLDADAPWLRFKTAVPLSSEHFLVGFTTPHTLDNSTSTIPAGDDEAIADLATSFCCTALANLYSQTGTPSMTADAVSYLTKAAEYRKQAASWRAAYDSKISAGSAQGAAAALVTVDTIFTDERDRLFWHGRRFR